MSSDWLFLLDSEWSIPPGSNKDGIFTPSEIKYMVDLGLKSEKEINDMIKENIPESIFKLFFGKEDE